MTGHAKRFPKNSLETLVKIISIGGVALYVIGLLVFNIFLVKYGVTDFAALKPQCLFTGAWTLLLLALAATPTVAFDALALSGTTRVWRRRLFGAIVMFGAAYVATVLVWVSFTTVLGPPLIQLPRLSFFDPGVRGWPILLIEITVLGVGTSLARSMLRGNTTNPWYLSTAISLIAPLVLGVFLIGRLICESVNPEVGGGRPLAATFYFAPDGLALLQYLRTESEPFHDAEPQNTLNVELLYAASDRYVFRLIYCRHLPNTSWEAGNIKTAFAPVAIDKKLIQGVFYNGLKSSVYGSNCPADITQAMIKASPPLPKP